MTKQVLVSRDALETLLDATFFSRFEHVDGGTEITIAAHKYAGFREAETTLRAALDALTPPAPAEADASVEIVKAAEALYDNRLGWSEGRNPYAPRELWDELGRALGRDPAGFCGNAEDAP